MIWVFANSTPKKIKYKPREHPLTFGFKICIELIKANFSARSNCKVLISQSKHNAKWLVIFVTKSTLDFRPIIL